MSVHQRKIKVIEFRVGSGENEHRFECQVKTWRVVNGTGDGERMYAQCPDGEFIEDAEDEYSLELEFFADWRSNGVSTWATRHDRQTVAFQIDHHPDVDAEHVRWSGTVKIKAPDAGGESRTTEMTTATWQIVGKPVFLGPDEIES